MATKNKLTELVAEGQRPSAIKRGQGVRLSTDVSSPPMVQPIGAQSHHRTIASDTPTVISRVNRGYKLREDLIKACKRLALETDRPLYAVMEDALAEYLDRHGTQVRP